MADIVGMTVLHPGVWKVTERLAELCQIDKDSRVLDIACGKGTSAIYRDDPDLTVRQETETREPFREDRRHQALAGTTSTIDRAISTDQDVLYELRNRTDRKTQLLPEV
jgi:cyclopropane fatty-acyl-phospholipid synthase-like methyltransferase